ncbi:MAG: ATP-binding protein [Candidatus Cloacimonadota bacterium]|nr:ATP-binding protein [Candidatus Cloacimonadota bacterium]
MGKNKIDLLTESFNNFTLVIDKFQKTYDSLNLEIAELNNKLEIKNEELEEKIAESENVKIFLNSILEHIYSGVIVVNNFGNVTVFNKAAETITHKNKVDLLNKNYQSFFNPQDMNKSKSLLYTLATGQESHHRQKIIVTPDGKKKTIEFSTSIIRDNNNKQLGVAEIFNDISELKKMQEKVSHVETLAALGEMASSVAHEIRNPLGGIGGFAGLLERKLPDNDDRHKLVVPIITGVNRLNNIVSDLLTFTRPQKMHLAEVNLHEVLNDIIKFFEISIEGEDKNIDIDTKFSTQKCLVHLDSSLFQQVMLNFLKNASDAIENQGNITISTKKKIPTNMSEILTEDEKKELMELFSFVEINITDTGSGISKEASQKLFNPFFTTKEEGNGLGLPICKKIIHLHKGDIHVKSKIGEGTTFTLTIPLYETNE